jgi:hypothetical protein
MSRLADRSGKLWQLGATEKQRHEADHEKCFPTDDLTYDRDHDPSPLMPRVHGFCAGTSLTIAIVHSAASLRNGE